MEVREGAGARLGRIAVTIGSFDGVHRGHRRLLERLGAMARRHAARAAVLTFDPHPREVLAPGREPPLLTTPAERERLLEAAGVHLLVRLRFDAQVADTEAERFVAETLLPMGEVVGFVVGYDFRFGKGRRGDVALLESLGRARGFEVECVAAQADEAGAVKSTRVREAVAAGEMRAAAGLLGRPHFVTGRVVAGEARGRALGFRTANVAPPDPRKLLPPDGVYAVRVDVGAAGAPAAAPGVANLGVRPTFGGGARVLEVHLLDGEWSLYSETVAVYFVERLRGEIAFEDGDALAAQIARDVACARVALAAPAAAPEGL
jgi:riboflavin kinase/FMN adenylyltransferase